MKKKHKIGIALSGGGVRGFAHLGVLKALNEKGVFPDLISGTSAGAIAGAFYASGKSPDEIFRIFKEKGLMGYTRIHLPVDGLLNLEGLRKNLKKQLGINDLKDLKTPCYIAVTNLNKGIVEYFNEGPAEQIILASSSIPILFSPIKIGNSSYADGGLFDNMPVTPLINKCEKIIGVNATPIQDTDKLDNLIQIGLRIFHLNTYTHTVPGKSHCALFIEPAELTGYEILQMKHAEKIFDIGYEYAKKMNIEI